MYRLAFSIKQKIIVSCAIVSVIIAGMIVATVYLLDFLETKIIVLEEATKLEGHVQELRRHEKNLFLYDDQSYGRKALFLVEGAQRILDSNRKDFDLATLPQLPKNSPRISPAMSKVYRATLSCFLQRREFLQKDHERHPNKV